MAASNIANMLREAAHESDQDGQIKLHRKHIQAIWRHLERLEQAIEIDDGDEIKISVGDASITMKKDGSITIKGGEITIDGSGHVKVKASRDLTLRGSKLLQN